MLVDSICLDDFIRPLSRQTDLGSNCRRGGSLVAGQHHAANSRPAKRIDQTPCFLPDRICHAHQTRPGEILSDLRRGLIIAVRSEGKAEDP
jgi:hypothetical protein